MLATAWHQTDPRHPLTMLTLWINTRTPERDVRWGPMWTLSVCVGSCMCMCFLGEWGRGHGAPPASSQTELVQRVLPLSSIPLETHLHIHTHTRTPAVVLVVLYVFTGYDCLSIIPREPYFSQHPKFTTIL